MALNRIRVNNPEFRNATLVGAQIRVRGGLVSNSIGRINPENIQRLQDMLAPEQTDRAQSILRDIMISDIIGQLRGRSNDIN